jgi:hypothetical protein
VKYIEYKPNIKAFLKIFFFLSDMLVSSNIIFIFAPAFKGGLKPQKWRDSSVG